PSHTEVNPASLCYPHDAPTTASYALSLHDALPISSSRTTPVRRRRVLRAHPDRVGRHRDGRTDRPGLDAPAPRGERHPRPPLRRDRKSTRLNSSHVKISYAVFCLKKKNMKTTLTTG